MRNIFKIMIPVICLGVVLIASDAQAQMYYRCVRPDGGEVCVITTTQADPSVTCNLECKDCNMVCKAEARIIRDGGQVMTSPGAPMHAGGTASETPGVRETPQFCNQQYASCLSACDSNPNNRDNYNLQACRSSCKSVRSGCGRTP